MCPLRLPADFDEHHWNFWTQLFAYSTPLWSWFAVWNLNIRSHQAQSMNTWSDVFEWTYELVIRSVGFLSFLSLFALVVVQMPLIMWNQGTVIFINRLIFTIFTITGVIVLFKCMQHLFAVCCCFEMTVEICFVIDVFNIVFTIIRWPYEELYRKLKFPGFMKILRCTAFNEL